MAVAPEADEHAWFMVVDEEVSTFAVGTLGEEVISTFDGVTSC